METMGFLDELRETSWNDLPIQHVMQRYGITKRDWDTVRTIPAWSPQKGATFFKPLDIMDTKLIDRDQLYKKFFNMVYNESKHMVPASTMEASVVLRGVSRPDTIAGLLLHSFAMYKNFPVTFAMTYGRLALSRPDKLTRVGFLAGLAVGMTGVGALGVQLRELKNGRTPLPMDTPQFWGKAFLAGGAAGLMGDFLFNGINEYGRGFATSAAGPGAGFIQDTITLTAGQPFRWVEAGSAFDGDFKVRLVEYARRYTPGSSIWWAHKVLGTEFFDRAAEAVDPKARQKQRKKIRDRQKIYGNTYWYEPGQQFGD